MYTDHLGITEYPFHATFYHLGVDETKPLDQQVEEKIVSFETVCDISVEDNINSNNFSLYFPFSADKETVQITLGESLEVETYGLVQKGRVLGVVPSQLGGVKVQCTRV